MKAWYNSKIIGVAALAILGAVSDGLINGWTWRQYAVAAIGAAMMVIRAYYTDTAIGNANDSNA